MMKLLTPKEAAAQLRVSMSTLRHWRKHGKGPPVVQVGPSSYRYSVETVERYITSRTSAAPTTQPFQNP